MCVCNQIFVALQDEMSDEWPSNKVVKRPEVKTHRVMFCRHRWRRTYDGHIADIDVYTMADMCRIYVVIHIMSAICSQSMSANDPSLGFNLLVNANNTVGVVER